MPLPDEDHLQAQYDECLSISLIYPDEFRLISGLACTAARPGTTCTARTSSSDGNACACDKHDATVTATATASSAVDLSLVCSPEELAHPIRYSVRLRPADDAAAAAGVGAAAGDPSLWPSDPTFALVVTYPPSYPNAPPVFSFSSAGCTAAAAAAALHPVQEEACLASIATAIRPDLAARNPCVLPAVAAARDFFLGGGLAAGLLHSVGEDVLGHVLAYAATDPRAVEDAVEAMPLFGAVRRTNGVWKQLCRLRWKAKWGYERRWRVALAEEREFCLRQEQEQEQQQPRQQGQQGLVAGNAAATNATWWYERYLWQEEDAKRSAMTACELTDSGWDMRRYFVSPRQNPDHMRDVHMSGLGRSARKPFRFVMHPHPGNWADRLPVGIPRDQALGAGPTWNLVDGRDMNLHWCLKKKSDDDPRPQGFAIYTLPETDARPLVGARQQVRRLDTWGWEIRCTSSVSRAIDLSSLDGDEIGDEIVATVEAQLEELWSDYLGNMITEEKPVWIKQGSTYELNYREIPDDDDLKTFLPW
mmetsp:Transcript_17785/g.50908  ORF Transcript_17785/g.50908 Transcript_17785/m.50908 type:complete len:533 (+) Transcript_17785:138-1736(+)